MQVHIRTEAQLGVALYQFRKNKNFTQAYLASEAGMRQATVSKAESGSETIQLATIIHLLAALDLELVMQPRLKGTIEEYLEST